MTITLRQLAELLGATFNGDPALTLHGIAPIETAAPGHITFLANKKYAKYLSTTRASAVILGEDTALDRTDIAILRMRDPYHGFVKTLRHFHQQTARVRAGIHPSSFIDPSASIGDGVSVGAHAVIEENVVIGDRTVIGAGAVVTSGVRIGTDCMIFANVTILASARLGDRVIIHAGTTIGSDGFGFAPVGETWEKIPQVGGVVIEDDVEIGANCAIDRATLGETVIRRGTKLDNLIQIAHNVEIGEHSVIAAQTGISGSTTLGRHVVLAGQVGVVGHIELGDGVIVGAQSGVSKSISGAGKMFRGSPAHDIQEALRAEAALRRLPGLITELRAFEARLKELEARPAPPDHTATS